MVNALSFKSKKLISGTQQTIISNCDVVYDLFESEIIKATTAEQKELKLEQEYFKMFKRISQKGDRKLFEDTFNRLKNEENYHFEYLFEQVISEQLNEKRIFAQSDSIQKILLEAFSSDLLIQQNIKTLEKVFDKKYIKFEKDSNMEFRARENELKSPIPYKIIATKN